jgi:hypothetical protein
MEKDLRLKTFKAKYNQISGLIVKNKIVRNPFFNSSATIVVSFSSKHFSETTRNYSQFPLVPPSRKKDTSAKCYFLNFNHSFPSPPPIPANTTSISLFYRPSDKESKENGKNNG